MVDMSVPMSKGESSQGVTRFGVRVAGLRPTLSSEFHAPGDRPSKREGHPVWSSSLGLRGPSSDSSHDIASPVVQVMYPWGLLRDENSLEHLCLKL